MQIAQESNPSECFVSFTDEDNYRMDDLLKLMTISQKMVELTTECKSLPAFARNAIGLAVAIRLASGKEATGFNVFMAKEKTDKNNSPDASLYK